MIIFIAQVIINHQKTFIDMSSAQVSQALQALYHHTDSSVKEQASQWLEQWQQSPEAWQVSHDVLHSHDAGLEAHYFAAQTLRTKVSFGLACMNQSTEWDIHLGTCNCPMPSASMWPQH